MRRLFAIPVLGALVACSSGDAPANGSPTPAGTDAPAEPTATATSTATEEPPAPPPPVDGGSDAAPQGKNYALGKSAGCGKAGGVKGLRTVTKAIAGKDRTALRFVPAGYDANKPLALVFGFHGMGGTAASSRTQLDLEAEAAGKAIFVYPQGLPDAAFENRTRWHQEKDSDDHKLVDALFADIAAAYCVDLDRVLAAGFSNGAEMVSMIGCYRGDTYRAIAPIAPGGAPAKLPLTGCSGEVAIWEGVGTEDATHQVASAFVRDYYRTANGCATTRTKTPPAGCEKYDGCRAKVPSTWCSYPGGHTVPAFAGAAVWSFFASLP